MLDLSRFKSVEDALAQVDAVRTDLHNLVKESISAWGGYITYASMFQQSAIARANCLHIAIVNAIETSNPHAAVPLLRAYADVVVTVLYVREHPDYIEALTSSRREAKRKRRKITALLDAVTPYASGVRRVYDELSEGTHFGAAAMWTSWILEDDKGTVTFASYPRWRDPERDPLLMAAWLIERGQGLGETVRSMLPSTPPVIDPPDTSPSPVI